MLTRLFVADDSAAIAQLFHDTVRDINCRDYSFAQVCAWAPVDIHFNDWQGRCAQGITYVAEDAEHIVGFCTLRLDGYIDYFYSHKNYQRCGVGTMLYRVLEAKARALGLCELTTAASITAKPFFQQQGFGVLKQQQMESRGQVFCNFVMQKSLQDLLR